MPFKDSERGKAWCRDYQKRRYQEQRKNPEWLEKRRRHNREYRARLRAQEPEKYRDQWQNWNLKRTYGITLEDYNKLLEEQGGVCKICGLKDQPGKFRLAVDHDHKTGAVRGILCNGCNGGLGLFKDSPTLLRRALDYLSQPA